jgi:hypothetical protein
MRSGSWGVGTLERLEAHFQRNISDLHGITLLGESREILIHEDTPRCTKKSDKLSALCVTSCAFVDHSNSGISLSADELRSAIMWIGDVDVFNAPTASKVLDLVRNVSDAQCEVMGGTGQAPVFDEGA